jgi:hypothetical protein
MAAVETEMKKLTDIAVALARYDERILAMTARAHRVRTVGWTSAARRRPPQIQALPGA